MVTFAVPVETTIGNYRVVGQLGEGGMGQVYVAEHVLLGRRVAIKVLHAGLSASSDNVQRFFNEAKAVSSVADPGIVQIFDFGHDANGNAYIVMELLEGEAMDRRLRGVGRFEPDACVRIAQLLCHSLASAHEKGIVHRDLKPENIFIVRDPGVAGGERPKILDFGIAKLTTAGTSSLKTRTGALMGTPVYMSPEQCRDAGEVDARSDIYSIGCVLTSMLTGRPPFLGETMGDLIVAHMREPPPRISDRLPEVDAELDRVVMRCLEKDPDARYRSARELGDALALVRLSSPAPRAAESRPAVEKTASSQFQTTLGDAASQSVLQDARRRPRLPFVLVGVGLVAIGTTIVITSRGASTPREQHAIAPPASVSLDASGGQEAMIVAVVPLDAEISSPTAQPDAALPPGNKTRPVLRPSTKTPATRPIEAHPTELPAVALSEAQISQQLDRLKGRLYACKDADEDASAMEAVQIAVAVAATGEVTTVRVDGTSSPRTAFGLCVQKILIHTTFPANAGTHFERKVRLR